MTHSLDESILLICPSCGYDLRAIPSERCPECGKPIDRSGMAVSRIPWVHRQAIGRFRAYWRTLILATFRMRKLRDEINRPVDLADAERFRWATVAIASVVVILVFGVAVWVHGGTSFLDVLSNNSPNNLISAVPPEADVLLPYTAGITRRIVLPLAVIFWLSMVSGLATYWFSPRGKSSSQRDRAVALSLYASSSLLLWLMFAALMWGLDEIAMSFQPAGGLPSIWVSISATLAGAEYLLASVVSLLFLINLLRLLGFTLRPGLPHMISFALGWPIACCLSGVIAFGLFPWIAGYIWLVIDSLR